jgi:hypothetical protein
VSVFADTQVVATVLEPNVAVAPVTKPLPEIVTAVVPPGGPPVGETSAIDGGTANVKAFDDEPVCPSGLLTTTSTVTPNVPAGLAHVRVLADTHVAAAVLAPNETVAPSAKLLPVTVTIAPPPGGPPAGDTTAIDGARAYVNPPTDVSVCPSGLRIVTSTGPSTPAGLAQVSVFADTHAVATVLDPNVAVAPVTNPLPVIVTAVVPPGGPPVGETSVIDGGIANVKAFGAVPVCPPGLVTVTSTVTPNVPAGLVHVSVLVDTHVAATVLAPNVTVAPSRKLPPVRLTVAPPPGGPPEGDTIAIDGAKTYVNPPTETSACPSGLRTVTSTAPSAPAGLMQVSVFPDTQAVATVLEPNVAVAPFTNSLPVIVTAVVPPGGPPFGEMPEIDGGSANVNALSAVLACPSGLLTVTSTVTPNVPAGLVHVRAFADTHVAATVLPPNETVAPSTKLLPVTFTVAPPPGGPPAGETATLDGASAYLKAATAVPVCRSGFVTVTSTVVPNVPLGLVHVS